MKTARTVAGITALLALAGAGAAPARAPVCVSNSPAPPAALTTNHAPSGFVGAADAATLRTQWGIEIASLRLSAHGRMLDFRYKVLDPAKAAALAARENRPHLIDQATGAILRVPSSPKIGPLRQTAAQLAAGKIYFVIFANTRGIVKSGSKVTVVIGAFRAENLTVQ